MIGAGIMAGVAGVLAVALVSSRPAGALELTGVLTYDLNMKGDRGPFWCTLTAGNNGRPLAIIEADPPGVRLARLENAANGTIDKPLLPGPYILTALWQYEPGEFSIVMMVLNLFFNGDIQTPGISAIVPFTRAFTQVHANPAPTTFSLPLGEVDNNGALFYDDGTLRVQLGAAFYFPSGGLTNRWRPSDFVNLDRVGVGRFTPDGRPDGVLVFELLVSPSPASPQPSGSAGRPAASGVVIGPGEARVGADQWVPPPTSSLVEVLPTPAASGERTAAEEEEAPVATSLPAATLEPARTPTPSARAPESAPRSPAAAPAITGTASAVAGPLATPTVPATPRATAS